MYLYIVPYSFEWMPALNKARGLVLIPPGLRTQEGIEARAFIWVNTVHVQSTQQLPITIDSDYTDFYFAYE